MECILEHKEDFGLVSFRVRYAGSDKDAWIDENELQTAAPHLLGNYWMRSDVAE